MFRIAGLLKLLFDMWAKAFGTHKISRQTQTFLLTMLTASMVVIVFFLSVISAIVATLVILVRLF